MNYLFTILNPIATLYMWVTCLVIRKEYQSDRDGEQRGQDSTSEDKSPQLILVLNGWSAGQMSAC